MCVPEIHQWGSSESRTPVARNWNGICNSEAVMQRMPMNAYGIRLVIIIHCVFIANSLATRGHEYLYPMCHDALNALVETGERDASLNALLAFDRSIHQYNPYSKLVVPFRKNKKSPQAKLRFIQPYDDSLWRVSEGATNFWANRKSWDSRCSNSFNLRS